MNYMLRRWDDFARFLDGAIERLASYRSTAVHRGLAWPSALPREIRTKKRPWLRLELDFAL
jgi:hypothetical protein